MLSFSWASVLVKYTVNVLDKVRNPFIIATAVVCCFGNSCGGNNIYCFLVMFVIVDHDILINNILFSVPIFR